MKIKQIKEWQDEAYKLAIESDTYAQKCCNEIRKVCEFEIKFATIDPSDGLLLVYDGEFEDMQISVNKIVFLYLSLERKITLDDIRTEF